MEIGRANRLFLLAGIACVASWTLLWQAGLQARLCLKPAGERVDHEELAQWIEQHEVELLRQVSDVQAGRKPAPLSGWNPSWSGAPRPSLDRNGNPCWVLEYTLHANWGFCLLDGTEPLAGDGIEPRTSYTRKLRGAWHFYKAS